MERALNEPDPNVRADASAEDVDSGATWSDSIARLVAAQIKYWRDQRGLSAKQLADKTNELGYHVPRSVIANLENNRRDTVGVAELLVLAAALDVPPIMLVTAIGLEPSVEILPDVLVTPWLARGWFIGAAVDVGYSSFSNTDWQQSSRAIALYDVHRLLVREHQQLETRMKRLEDQAAGVERQPAGSYEGMAAEFAYSIDRIRLHRGRMQKEGLLLPDLPPGVASLLRETDSGGRHHR